MKTLITLTFLLSLTVSTTFAGTLIGNNGGDKKEKSELSIEGVDSVLGSNSELIPNENTDGPRRDSLIQPKLKQAPTQVYYMGENETEVKFATNVKGTPEVEVKVAKPEEITNMAFIESLRKSQATQQWIEVRKKNSDSYFLAEEPGTFKNFGGELPAGGLKGIKGLGNKGLGGLKF